MTRDSFIFYRSFFEAVDELNPKEQAKTYRAIINFALNEEEETKISGISKMIYSMAKPLIEANNKKYRNGKKGGRPKDEDSPKKNIKDIEYVILTETQYDKLIEKFGDTVTNKAIKLLDNWLAKGSPTAKGYIGKNHYAHFRSDNWCIKQAQEEQEIDKTSIWGNT